MSNELQEVLEDIQEDKLAYLKPQNIKKGITVLGVTGTLTGVNNQTKIITENGILQMKLSQCLVVVVLNHTM